VTHFLDALVDDKISFDSIAGTEIFEKLKDSFISQGYAFKENDAEIEFDKELELLFDDNTKERLRKLFKSKIIFILLKIYFSEKFMKINKEEDKDKDNLNGDTVKEEQDKDIYNTRKRFMILFLYERDKIKLNKK